MSRIKTNTTSFILVTLLAQPVYAAEPPTTSLFFTDDEVQKIESLATRRAPSLSHVGDIHLGAVMYYGPDDWAVWLEGTRWTPDSAGRADLHIIAVKPGQVDLTWAGNPNAAPLAISLRPYQTYQMTTGRIVEGYP